MRELSKFLSTLVGPGKVVPKEVEDEENVKAFMEEMSETVIPKENSSKARKEAMGLVPKRTTSGTKDTSVFQLLPIGGRFGRLTIIREADGDSPWLYGCDCDCGKYTVLDSETIKRRDETDSGCLELGCSASSGQDLYQTDIETCILDQFRRLNAYHHEGLDMEWCAGFPGVSLQDSYQLFRQFVKGMGATATNGMWYLRKKAGARSFKKHLVTLGDRDILDGSPGDRVFKYEGIPIPIEEATELLNCRVTDITDLQDEFINDDDIFESLV